MKTLDGTSQQHAHARQLSIQYGRQQTTFRFSYSACETLVIDVNPDLSVTVTAPKDADDAAVEQKMHKRASWIVQQQRYFENYLPTLPARRYVSGESHRYLGRQYRMRVHRGAEDSVKMARDQLNAFLADPSKKKRVTTLVVGWFRQCAEVVFRELFDQMVARAERRVDPARHSLLYFGLKVITTVGAFRALAFIEDYSHLERKRNVHGNQARDLRRYHAVHR